MTNKTLIFISVLLICLVLQKIFAWRVNRRGGAEYWKTFFSHLLLVGIGNVFIRVVQFLGVGTSLFLIESNGPLNINLVGSQSPWIASILSLLLLDFVIYWQHRLAHKLPILWRFHKVHHADQQMEASSGIRFHPIEIFFSFYYKLGICWLFSVTLENYILFELILMSSALFNHSNLDLPGWLEKPLALVIVTPRVHFVHHSIESENMHRNFGFFMSLWDRIFGSFKKLPEEQLLSMPLGVKQSNPIGLLELLKEPFR